MDEFSSIFKENGTNNLAQGAKSMKTKVESNPRPKRIKKAEMQKPNRSKPQAN